MALDFEPGFPKRITDGGFNHHPTVVETTRGLIAAVFDDGGIMKRTFSLDRGEDWASVERFASGSGNYQARAGWNYRGGFGLAWMKNDNIWFEEVLEVMTISDHLMDVRVSRSTDATTKEGTFKVANPKALYDPETVGKKWSGVIFPGARVEYWAGFGGLMKQRFAGYVDNVDLLDSYAQIDFTCRGDFKQLLDQSADEDLFYTDKKATAVMAEAAVRAGIDPNKIVIQDSNVLFTGKYTREKKFSEIVQEMADLLGFIVYEPDEGGMIAREPDPSTSPVWFFEEEENMFSRARRWDDDKVFTRVVAYRKDKLKKDGTLHTPGFRVEVSVDTPFQTPPRKTEYIKCGQQVSETQADIMARARARQIALEGQDLEIATPLNVALEVGDVVSVRRKSLDWSGLYVIDDLDDEYRRQEAQARDMGGEFAVGSVPGFANIVRARKI